MEGTLAADAASLRDTLRWAADRTPPGGGFGRFALKAQTNVAGGNIALSGVNVELDGNVGEGVLTFAADGRQTAAGHARRRGPRPDALRLDGPPAHRGERNWNRVPIALDGLNGIDVDLRLSAARVTIGQRQARPHRGRRQSARRQSHASRSANRRPSAA